jgi:hypothetical protein
VFPSLYPSLSALTPTRHLIMGHAPAKKLSTCIRSPDTRHCCLHCPPRLDCGPVTCCYRSSSAEMSLFDTVAPYVVGTVAGVLVLGVLRHQAARRSLPLPPGPRPLPIIGNLLDIPQEKQWLTYHSWNEKYGDVVFIEALGQKIVILGNAAVVNDLMERRSAVYSDRPGTLMMNEL